MRDEKEFSAAGGHGGADRPDWRCNAGALVILLAIYIVAGVLFIIYRPAEAGQAFRTSGALGFAGFIHRTLLSGGFSRLLGRMPPPPEQPTPELQQMIAQLETELAALRASLTGPRALPTHL